MAAGIIYTLEFTNVEDVFVKVNIADNSIQTTDPPTIISLDPAGNPLQIVTIDNGENKYTPIKSQQAIITFLSNSSTSLLTFRDGPDDRFSVTVLYGTTIVFYGFLSLADNQEPFLPPRVEVTLTANDKLGALKEIPLTDFDGENPQGKYRIGQLIAMCLQKTGLSLPLRVINNLRHGTGAKSFQVTFGSPNSSTILMANENTAFFYVGQRVAITGTVSNNVTFTVFSVGTAIVGVVTSSTAVFTLESDVIATFTDTSSADHIYKGTFLDAKTFEDSIGISENCYTVLEKILGFDCFLTQYKEAWWICRIDEYIGSNLFYVSRFDENGEYIDSYEETTPSKNIGFNETHWLSDEAGIVLPTRPIGFDKLTYNFEFPEEILCNQDFVRGTGGDPVDDSNPNQTITLIPECWTFASNGDDSGINWPEGPPQTGARGELIKRYEFGYEKERYFLIEHEDVIGIDRIHFLKSEAVDLRAGDKINLSVDFRIEGVSGFTSLNPMKVALIPHDGSLPWDWELDISTGVNRWVQRLTANENPFLHTFRWTGTDSDQYHNVGDESTPLPASGFVYIYLSTNFNVFAPYLFTNLQFTYIPFTNGSYRAYNGRYEKVTRTTAGYLANIDDEVFISDAEGKLFKGAMFFLADSTYILTVKWYNAALYALGSPTDLTKVQPFGWQQIFAMWNQYRLANTILQFNLTGFGADIPSLIHRYAVMDLSGHTENRYFLLLRAEKDLFLCSMTGTIEQVFHTIEDKEYTSTHEFKYIG